MEQRRVERRMERRAVTGDFCRFGNDLLRALDGVEALGRAPMAGVESLLTDPWAKSWMALFWNWNKTF